MMPMMDVDCGPGSYGLMEILAGHRHPLYIRSELACLGLSGRHEAGRSTSASMPSPMKLVETPQ